MNEFKVGEQHKISVMTWGGAGKDGYCIYDSEVIGFTKNGRLRVRTNNGFHSLDITLTKKDYREMIARAQ